MWPFLHPADLCASPQGAKIVYHRALRPLFHSSSRSASHTTPVAPTAADIN
jgi:hypothetical protein